MPDYSTYSFGSLPRLVAEFRDVETGDLYDPDEVNISVRAPDGTTITYAFGTDSEVVNDEAGVYYADIDADQAGVWSYRWWATGDGQAAARGRFEVLSEW